MAPAPPVERRPGARLPWLKLWHRTAESLRSAGAEAYGVYCLLIHEANLYEWDEDGVGWLVHASGAPLDMRTIATLCGITPRRAETALRALTARDAMTCRADVDGAWGIVGCDIDQDVYSETQEAARARRYRARRKARVARAERDDQRDASRSGVTGERDGDRDASRPAVTPTVTIHRKSHGRRSEKQKTDQNQRDERETRESEALGLERDLRARAQALLQDADRLAAAGASAQVIAIPRAAPDGG